MGGVRVKLGDLIADRYRLDAVAGRGGVGVVHRATDTTTGAPVQVTVLYARIRAVLDPARIESVRDALGALQAPALARPVDITADPAAIVTAPVAGRSLAGLLAEGPLSAPTVAALGADLADGLAPLHARGLVHRWIRPSAIAVGDGGRPVLLDVGVTELLTPQYYTAIERLVGTTAYVSPEQVRNEPVGPATDVYTLGLVLLEALTGAAAYPGTGAAEAVARALVAPVVPETADPRLARLLTAATAFRPEARPSARELAAELRALLAVPAVAPRPAARPVEPRPPEPRPTGPRRPVPLRRRRGVLVTGGLALLAAVVLAGGSGAGDRVLVARPASAVSGALGAEHAVAPVARPVVRARPSHGPVAPHPVAHSRRVAPAAAPVASAPVAPSSTPAHPAPAPRRTRRAAPAPTVAPTHRPAPTPTVRPTPTPHPPPTPSPSPPPPPSPSPTPSPAATASPAG